MCFASDFKNRSDEAMRLVCLLVVVSAIDSGAETNEAQPEALQRQKEIVEK